jgi:hypothetical protein
MMWNVFSDLQESNIWGILKLSADLGMILGFTIITSDTNPYGVKIMMEKLNQF